MKKKVLIVIVISLFLLFLGILIINAGKIKNFISQKYQEFNKKYVFIDKEKLEVQVPVLMYHYIANYGTDVSTLEDPTIISADAFKEQMEWLYNNGYSSLTMEEFICWKKKECEIENNRFLLTIDDGFTSTYNFVEPILKEYNFTAVQFVVNEFLNKKTPTFKEQPYAYMGYDYIEDYSRDTIEIGSHTYNMHHQLPEIYAKVNGMTYDEIFEDVKKSKDELNTTYISYPYGAVTEDAIKAVKDAGYECGFALNGSMTYQGEDIYRISRISATEDFEAFKVVFETDTYRKKSIKPF